MAARAMDVASPPKHIVKAAIKERNAKKRSGESKVGGPPPGRVFLTDGSAELGVTVYGDNPSRVTKVSTIWSQISHF